MGSCCVQLSLSCVLITDNHNLIQFMFKKLMTECKCRMRFSLHHLSYALLSDSTNPRSWGDFTTSNTI